MPEGCQTMSPTVSKTRWQAIGWACLGPPPPATPVDPSESLHCRAGESNFSIHTRCALNSQLYRSSALLLKHLPYFNSFSRNFVSHAFTKNSPWLSRAAGPRYFPAKKVWAHGGVSLRINASRGHTKICRREKMKLHMFTLSEELGKALLVHNSCACRTL